MKKKDEIGNRYGKLIVLSEHSKTRNGHTRYKCKCDCGNESEVLGTHLRRKNTTDCGCTYKEKIGDKHPQWKGCGEISGNYWSSILRGANGNKGRSKIDFNISIEYAWDLFLKQNKKCAFTGLDLIMPMKTHKDKTGTASLDRINSDVGYVEGNVQWVNKDINLMKNKLDQEYFKYLCLLVSKNSACEVVF